MDSKKAKDDKTKTGMTPTDGAVWIWRNIEIRHVLTITITVVILLLLGIPIVSLYQRVCPWLFVRNQVTLNQSTPLQKKEFLLVPANEFWVDSEIILKPSDTIVIRASGRITISMHHMVKAAIEDTKPITPWISPEGLEFGSTRGLYGLRQRLLVDNKSNIGALLMYAGPANNIITWERNPHPKPIQCVGKYLEYTNESDSPQKLYFVVNDTILTSDEISKQAYAGKNQNEVNTTYGYKEDKISPMHIHADLLKKWNVIESSNYFTIWYDDNCGQFLVEVTFHES